METALCPVFPRAARRLRCNIRRLTEERLPVASGHVLVSSTSLPKDEQLRLPPEQSGQGRPLTLWPPAPAHPQVCPISS